MSARHPASSRSTPGSLGFAVLVAIGLVALLVTGGQLAHIHESETLGLYNEEHVVQGLAALTNAGPLPEAPTAAYLLLLVVVAAVVREALCLAVPAARHAAPRAPPAR